MKKICYKCGKEKEENEFSKNQTWCKECQRQYFIDWKSNHPGYFNEKYKKKKENDLNYLEKMNNYQKKYNSKRRQKDPFFKLVMNIRNLISAYVKRLTGEKVDRNIEEILGCSYEEFKVYLESYFKPWMNWENYGGRMEKDQQLEKRWEINHKIAFRFAESVGDVYKLNHYTNLEPLDQVTNRRRKRNK
jgi:hypothetical protein